MISNLKPILWIGSSYRDLLELPVEVRKLFGFALDQAQRGGKHPDAKPLKGFRGAGVIEIVHDHFGNTFRSVYTIRFAEAIYVLHVFQKKSKRGICTPKKETELIKRRLKEAEINYAAWRSSVKAKSL